MEYTLGNANYNKRGLTKNIIFKIIANEYEPVKKQAPEYEEAAKSLKNAELTSQRDACPVVGRDELKRVIETVRTRIPELRARHTQTGTAISADSIIDVTDDDALFQIVNGTYINVSSVYDDSSKEQLLSKGILPLYSKEVLPVGTIVFVEGISDVIKADEKELNAYIVEDKLIPVKLQLAVDPEKISGEILNE